MKIINLIKAEFVMLVGELKQYYWNYIFFNLGMLLLFIGMFYSNPGTDSDAIILLFGLVTWQMCTSSIGYLCYVIEDESLLGTLEQIFMTRTSVLSVFVSKVFVNLIFSLLKGSVLFVICLFIFGVSGNIVVLGWKLIPIFLIIIFTVISFYFLGLMFGGIALFQKRISSVIQTLTYLMLFFTNIKIPVEELPKVIQPISYAIPMTWASKCIGVIVRGEISMDTMMNPLLGLIITSLFFAGIGYFIFKNSIMKAKMLGKLGQY